MRWSLIPLLALAACGGAGGEAPTPAPATVTFDFTTAAERPFSIEVTAAGAPAAGAIVQVVDVLRIASGSTVEESTTGGHYFTGCVRPDGRVSGELRLPTAVTEVDVIVTYPGASGPIDEPALRALWGPFAPAARVHAAVGQLGALSIHLNGGGQ